MIDPTPTAAFVSTAVVAAWLGVCARTIVRWSASGENGFPPPSIVRARCKRWRRALIEDWIRQQERRPRGMRGVA